MYRCLFSFWWNHTRSPENFKGGSVRHAPVRYAPVSYAPVRYAPVRYRCGGTNPRRVRPRGYRFQRPPAERSEARPSRRAKRGLPAERSEAPPRLRRAKRGRAKVIGRSPLQKNSKRFHQKAQGNHLLLSLLFYRGYLIKILLIIFKKKICIDYKN